MQHRIDQHLPHRLRTELARILAIVFIALVGTYVLMQSHAATGAVDAEVELGSMHGGAAAAAIQGASAGSAVRFGAVSSDAGAALPIQYSLAQLPGTVRYVATTGNDTTGNGNEAQPYATLARAVSASASGDSIVVRGGTYRQGKVVQSAAKRLRITAYPGEVPVFNGARAVSGGWIAEGSVRYIPYTPQPVTDGSGISFTTGQNLSGDGMGKYPDQVWAGATQLRQVAAKASVTDSTFWVDSVNSRLYVSAATAARQDVEVSDLDNFLDINAPDTIVEGLDIRRFSNSANDYGVIDVAGTADRTVLRQLRMSGAAFQMVLLTGNSNILDGVRMEHVTLDEGNWMGVVALLTDNFTMSAVRITGMNQYGEFTSSPQSGALKTGRTWHTTVTDSYIANNRSHGLWFDQSNYNAIVANNYIANNLYDAGSPTSNVFYEISDKFLLINNYLVQSGAGLNVKLAGSSGLSVINNTIIGGASPLGVYTDSRSMPGCADPSQPLCPGSYNSERDTVRQHLTTMDWMPRLDYMVNNIIAYPTGSGYCGVNTAVCITSSNASASAPIASIIHHADPSRGIPQTFINNNVYANGSSRLYTMSLGGYTALGPVTAALAASPVSIPGLEGNSLAGNNYVNSDGTPTAALISQYGNALPVPADAVINRFVPAGTRKFGIL